MQKLWFSIFDFSFNYKGTEPPFEDPSHFAWSKEFSLSSDAIKKELEEYLHKHKLASYFNTHMVASQGTWKTIALKTWSVELFKNQKEFPLTTSLLKKYPEILSCSFNLLEPNGKILPHCGDTNAIYRCHMGLEIPAGLPDCGFKVKGEPRSWEYGKWLVFIDAYEHEAWNNTSNERYILLLDVLREEFRTKKGRVVSTVLTSLFLQKRAESLPFLYKHPSPTGVRIVTTLLRPFAWTAIKVYNLLKIY